MIRLKIIYDIPSAGYISSPQDFPVKKGLLDIQNANNATNNIMSTQVYYAHTTYLLSDTLELMKLVCRLCFLWCGAVMTTETSMPLYYRHQQHRHIWLAHPCFTPTWNLASYLEVVTDGVSEMNVWNGTGWAHEEGQSLRTPALDPEAPSPLRASQAHELDLGPEDKEVGLVGKLLFKQKFTQTERQQYASGWARARARILFHSQAEKDRSTTKTINTSFKSIALSLLCSQSPRAAHTSQASPGLTCCPDKSSSRSSSRVTASSPLSGRYSRSQAWSSRGRMERNCSSTSSSRICSLVWISGRSHWWQSSFSRLRASRGPKVFW